ncbi:hypothetical protein KZY42_002808 [Vibrio vulnificus]|nr:hypothetical protein [Vibrio vulnificus]MCA3938765.1 hypothetical protein [Vibrio vulnificus]HAS8179687.1 hypothetical protein [Vibrio vulnificus]
MLFLSRLRAQWILQKTSVNMAYAKSALLGVESSCNYTFQSSGDFCQILYQPEKQPQIVSLTDGC